MKILVITSSGIFPRKDNPSSGIFFANLLLRLQPLVERITVVTPASWIPYPLLRFERFHKHRFKLYHEHWRGIEVFRPRYLPIAPLHRLGTMARLTSMSAVPFCEALHRRYNFDVVIGYGFGPPAHAACCVARSIGRRSVCWAIGTDVNTWPTLSAENARAIKHNARYVDLMLTESDMLRATLQRYGAEQRVHTYYKGIEQDSLRNLADKTELRTRLGLSPDRTYVLMVGRVTKAKGSDEFYEAFRELSRHRPLLDAIWLGEGDQEQVLRQRAAEDGLSDRLTLTGQVPRELALEYVRSADLLLFPSHAEGLPNVVMEALACEVPTVATDVGGISEIIIDGATGLLTPPRDAASLTKAAARMLDDPKSAARMASRGRSLILDHFDVKRNAPVALSILEHVVSGGSADAPLPACAGIAPGKLPADIIRDECR